MYSIRVLVQSWLWDWNKNHYTLVTICLSWVNPKASFCSQLQNSRRHFDQNPLHWLWSLKKFQLCSFRGFLQSTWMWRQLLMLLPLCNQSSCKELKHSLTESLNFECSTQTHTNTHTFLITLQRAGKFCQWTFLNRSDCGYGLEAGWTWAAGVIFFIWGKYLLCC